MENSEWESEEKKVENRVESGGERKKMPHSNAITGCGVKKEKLSQQKMKKCQ